MSQMIQTILCNLMDRVDQDLPPPQSLPSEPGFWGR